MLLNDNIDDFIKPVVQGHGGSGRHGNVFLTPSWKLYIDLMDEQHNVTLDRLGLVERELLLSGYWHSQAICWRSSPGEDSGAITNDEARMMMKACDRIIIREVRSRGFRCCERSN